MLEIDISTTKLATGGRIVIPARIRKALGWKEGEELVFQVDVDRLTLVTRSQSRRWARKMVQGLAPKGVSLAEELIKDRRRESALE